MTVFRQIGAITAMNLLSVPKRPGASTVIVITVASVVGVFVCVLALSTSFINATIKTGRSDRAIVLSRGAETESASHLTRGNIATILNAQQIRQALDGKPIVSAEVLALARLSDKRTGLDAFATVRGIGAQAYALRPEIKLAEGQMFKPALREVIVGRAAQRRIRGLSLGDRISLLPGDNWTVVGVFESGEDSHESELMTDAETLLSASQQNVFSSVTVLLNAPADFESLRAVLIGDPMLSVEVKRESNYFREASEPTGRALQFIAYGIGGIMALGAVFAAMNAMYSAVSTRGTEIGTLRAIGYSGAAVVISVFIEALVLALTGAAAGAVIAWYLFNGSPVSSLSGTSPSPTTYSLRVNASLIGFAMMFASAIGLLGALGPAVRSGTRPVATVMREQ